MTKRLFALITLALAICTTAFAANIPKSIPWVATGPFEHVDGSGPHRDSTNFLIQARAARLTANAAAANQSRDVGDVAVIVDDGTLIVQPRPANFYDLASGTTLTFSPGVDQFTVSSAAGGVVADTGTNLGLGDDAATPVEAVDSGTFAGFSFFGTTYGTDSIFVGSDGHITFGAGDGSSTARDAARHIGGPPRVSALLVDLDPSSAGAVRAEVNANTVVVTWDGVPQFGNSDSNTFQVVLHSDGTVDLSYGSVAASVGVVGVAEGNDEGPFSEVDLTADLPGTFPAGAIFEEFAAAIVTPQMNTLGVAQRFLETHPDEFDFIVIFTDFVVNIGGGAFAFHQGVQNQTFGLGLRAVFDGTAAVENAVTGDIQELESVLNMNNIGLYWPDANKLLNPPIKMFRFSGAAASNGPPGPNLITRRARRMGTLNGDFGAFGSYTLGLNSAMSIMGQEAGHRWLAFPVFFPPSLDFSDFFDLLGRSNAHWSFFHNVRVPNSQFGGDPRASSAEGNAIADLGAAASNGLPVPCDAGAGESTFLTEPDELIDGFTELDQYFMGLRSAGDVPSFWYVDDPRSAFSGNPFSSAVASFSAQDDVLLCGKRVDLNVSDITAIGPIFGIPENGPRIPAIGDEVDSCGVDVKTMAFVLLVPNEGATHNDGIRRVQTFLETWEIYANGDATGGLGRFDTSLNPVCH